MTSSRARTRDEVWLVAIDMQRIFGEPSSEWFTPRFAEASAAIQRLRDAFPVSTVFTRFIAPAQPAGAWTSYYETWPFAVDPANVDRYELMPEFPCVRAP